MSTIIMFGNIVFQTTSYLLISHKYNFLYEKRIFFIFISWNLHKFLFIFLPSLPLMIVTDVYHYLHSSDL